MPGTFTIVSVGLVALLLLAAGSFWLLGFLDRNGKLTRAVQAFFRRGPKAPRTPGADHYYTAFWAKRG